MRGIGKAFLALPLAVALMMATGCTETREPEAKAPETVRERAEKVGKLGDKTFTSHLEKDLVGIVDSAADNAEELEKANRLSDE
ncbi:MAG: hypothetical protein OEZ32_00375 [Nitrospinota bacterium]|nr:hypothetical protein [Nitrospinota bacterium]